MPNDDYEDAYTCGGCGERIYDCETAKEHDHGR
jgi:hypothetical protein